MLLQQQLASRTDGSRGLLTKCVQASSLPARKLSCPGPLRSSPSLRRSGSRGQVGRCRASSSGLRASSAEHERLANQLLEAEAELQAMFDGPVPPSAKEVAKQRARVSEVKQALEDAVAHSLPAGAAQSLAAAGAAAAVSKIKVGRAAPLLREGQGGASEGWEQQSPAAEFDVSKWQLTLAERTQAESLAAENAHLRARAVSLLERQRELEGLLDEHLASFNRGPLGSHVAYQGPRQDGAFGGAYGSGGGGYGGGGSVADDLLTDAGPAPGQLGGGPWQGIERLHS